jgi:exosortase
MRPSTIFLLLGLATIVGPTVLSLGKWSWSTEAGAHGPIVLATAIWLIWRDRGLLADGRAQPLWPGVIVLLLALMAYLVGRVTGVMALEGVAAIMTCVIIAFLRWGAIILTRFWFHILYLFFILTPPENWMFVATRPLKQALSAAAVESMSWLGMSIAGSVTTIFVEGYRLQVAAACSGVNSMVGITAIGLFYIYLRHGSQPRYALVLAALLIPLTIIINFLRILMLIVATYYYGDGAVFHFAHDFGGMGMFMLALLALLGIDALLHPLLLQGQESGG